MPTDIQQQIIKELQIPSKFDVERETRRRIEFLKNYLRSTGLKSYVLGISGGVDSTTAGRLAQLAVDELCREGYEAIFIGVRLPYKSQKDEEEAQLALMNICPSKEITVNIGNSTDILMDEAFNVFPYYDLDFHKGNVKARMRMISQYLIAGVKNGLVIGTDHGAEAVMGFFTKFGDGAADILPLSGLTKRRVRAIASFLGIDETLINKTPTADLEDDRPQLPDEEAHGVSYDEIDDFLEGKEVSQRAHDIIVTAYNKTIHKRALPVTP